jgi:cytochrome c556
MGQAPEISSHKAWTWDTFKRTDPRCGLRVTVAPKGIPGNLLAERMGFMFRKLMQCSVFAVMGVAMVLATYGWAISANKAASISDVMKASFGKNGFKAKITAAAKEKNYDEVATLAKGWVDCVENLLQNKPPKGDEGAWKERAGKFLNLTREILAAAEKGDGKGINAGLGAIGKLCGDCHKNHR